MTPEQINKAIEEEAKKRFTYYVDMVKNSKEINYLRKGLREAFIEGAKFREELERTITSSTNLEQQNTTQGLSNLFETNELAERFLALLSEQVEEITFGGSVKINKIDQFGKGASIVVCVPKYKKMERSSYWISFRRSSKVTLDSEEINPQSNPELKAEEKGES